jgi:hypothetical protein
VDVVGAGDVAMRLAAVLPPPIMQGFMHHKALSFQDSVFGAKFLNFAAG